MHHVLTHSRSLHSTLDFERQTYSAMSNFLLCGECIFAFCRRRAFGINRVMSIWLFKSFGTFWNWEIWVTTMPLSLWFFYFIVLRCSRCGYERIPLLFPLFQKNSSLRQIFQPIEPNIQRRCRQVSNHVHPEMTVQHSIHMCWNSVDNTVKRQSRAQVMDDFWCLHCFQYHEPKQPSDAVVSLFSRNVIRFIGFRNVSMHVVANESITLSETNWETLALQTHGKFHSKRILQKCHSCGTKAIFCSWRWKDDAHDIRRCESDGGLHVRVRQPRPILINGNEV